MSDFGNNLNIVISTISTLFIACVDVIKENIPTFAKDFKYKTNATFVYMNVLYEDVMISDHTRDFFMKYHHLLLLFLHVIFFIELVWERTSVSILHISLIEEKKEIKKQRDLICSIRSFTQEKERLVEYYKSKYNIRQKLIISIEAMIKQCSDAVDVAHSLRKDHNNLCDAEILRKKFDNIEEIMISGDYNDPEYLKYDKRWTIDLLKEKAIQMEIPDIKWGSKTALGFVIRTVEQLTKIGDIVQPVYPDGYETEDMVEEDDNPDSDSEWLPPSGGDGGDDSC
jgi:hypothetical protein